LDTKDSPTIFTVPWCSPATQDFLRSTDAAKQVPKEVEEEASSAHSDEGSARPPKDEEERRRKAEALVRERRAGRRCRRRGREQGMQDRHYKWISRFPWCAHTTGTFGAAEVERAEPVAGTTDRKQ